MTVQRQPRRSLFRQFSNVPNGVPIAEHGEVIYTVEPLHAEVLLSHRLAFMCDDPYCGSLHLYDDTFICEVVEVLSRPPESIQPEPWMLMSPCGGQDQPPCGHAA